jgi:hypothetical protein
MAMVSSVAERVTEARMALKDIGTMDCSVLPPELRDSVLDFIEGRMKPVTIGIDGDVVNLELTPEMDSMLYRLVAFMRDSTHG